MSDQSAEENVVFFGDTKLKVSDFSDEQSYFHSQILDLRNKRARITFELDQTNAALNVFENKFIEATKEKSNGVIEK